MKSQRRAKAATTRTTAQEQPQMTTTPAAADGRIGRNGNIRPVVLQHLERNPGKIIYISDLQQVLPEASKAGLQNAARELAKDHPIEIVVAGNAWRYDPTRKTAPAEAEKVGDAVIFTLAGRLSSGLMILEDEHGKTYKAVPVEF